jgi:membrane protease YdiL (CAAX protease family)
MIVIARRLLTFVAGATLAVAVSIPAAAFITVVLGLSRPDVAMAVASGIISVALTGLSAYLLRREGTPFAALGLPTSRTRVQELALGFGISAALFLAVAVTQSAAVGASWHFQGATGAASALAGLVMAGTMVLAEELLFRGLGLRYLCAMYGDRAAIALSALLFGAYHLVGSPDWAMGAVFRFVMPALGGLLFGWAAIRSGGLALPIGLHLGGNWVQANVAGFTAPGVTGAPAVWRIPLRAADMQALTAPDLLPRLPYLLAIGAAAVLTWMFLRSTAGQLKR